MLLPAIATTARAGLPRMHTYRLRTSVALLSPITAFDINPLSSALSDMLQTYDTVGYVGSSQLHQNAEGNG